MASVPWVTLEQARQHWADARAIEDDVLRDLLEAALDACEEYVYDYAYSYPVGARFRLANIYQAREIYTASQRDEQDVIGVGDYAIRARPLTAAVKQLLRPQKGRPAVG